MKKLLRKLIRIQKGQSLPMVLILMAVGGLIIAPLLSYTSSGLKVGKAYEKMADEYYAADAGIEDGLWQIKYNNLEELFTNYQRYNYSTVYQYPISYPVVVNGLDVQVSIKNVWIPKDIAAPTHSQAEELIGAGKLIITGGVPAELTHQVKIYYYKGATDPPLYVNKIGVWLPPGINYNEDGVCTLENWLIENGKTYSRNITSHQGGQAVIWTFTQPIRFTELPGVSTQDTPMTYEFTFNFILEDPESERSPEALSWVTTSGVSDIPYTWDADVRVFHIISQAGGADGVTINAYSIRSELRELGSTINGDYRAIGNTLMLDLHPDWGGPVRDTLLSSSDAAANNIPENAQVDRAYLYWSAWIMAGTQENTLFSDDCSNIDEFWNAGSDWDEYYSRSYGNYYGAHHYSGGSRELVMKDNLELSIYGSGDVTISLDYWKSGNLESDDCLKYSFYRSSGWSSWYNVFCDDSYNGASNSPKTFTVDVPTQYLTDNFRMKFQISGFDGSGYGGDEICYIDNIEVVAESIVTADTTARFKINGNPVYFANDEYGKPTVPAVGNYDIIADDVSIIENTDTPQEDYSYCCRKDVTALIQEFTEHGNATYTLGSVDGTVDSQWSYAGWSLIIIYSSPDTQRHQLYLFDLKTDNFKYIAPNTAGEKFSIGGFLVPDPIAGEQTAATITCFVGDGDDFYSGDFIALNAPDVPGYQIANSYKLWDGITLSPPSFPPYMPNTSSSPNNVWNSQSVGLTASGVDIDTFTVPWGNPLSSGLLKPGDSSATVVLNFADPNPIYAELINFIYIIISFRSRTVTGGTITYLIEG